MKNRVSAILFALLAAVLYGISSPVSRLLLDQITPTMMAALLYLGAGFGMLLISLTRRLRGQKQLEAKLTKRELPYIAAMLALDIAAPVLLMIALTRTTAANVSLLNNFEIVSTAMIALIWFKEAIGRRLWIALFLITTASLLLSVSDGQSLSFSAGSVLVILACICWGLENNCTRMLSIKDPVQIVIIKGIGSGSCALIIALITGTKPFNVLYGLLALLLGFVAFGLSIYFYILAQRTLGAARTSAYYAAAPFVGVAISITIFDQTITWTFVAALATMIAGAYFAVFEQHRHLHRHEALVHEHRHRHMDGHHEHPHTSEDIGEHSHVHTHEPVEHVHDHTPDAHHKHEH